MNATKEILEIVNREKAAIFNLPKEEIDPNKCYYVKNPENGLTCFWIWGSELLKRFTPEYKKMIEDWREEEAKFWYGEKI